MHHTPCSVLEGFFILNNGGGERERGSKEASSKMSNVLIYKWYSTRREACKIGLNSEGRSLSKDNEVYLALKHDYQGRLKKGRKEVLSLYYMLTFVICMYLQCVTL
uniref:Uncharacterized protein n=2 Tax=Lepeophtheirus salmonis TaxID=72036 RepID=A0A0K2V3S0_LEPSM